MPNKYSINTLQDMMEIPLERFNTFLSDMTTALTLARTAHAYNKAIGAKGPTIPGPFVWIDDYKGELRMNITWKAAKKGENMNLLDALHVEMNRNRDLLKRGKKR